MKLFPTKNYTFELNGDSEKLFELLVQSTLHSRSMTTHKTDNPFIGQVSDKKFKIINSEAGIGAFAVCEGSFSEDEVNMTVYINRPFKVLVFVILILMLFSVTLGILQDMTIKSIGFLVPILMVILFLRYVLLGLFFKRSTDLTVGKITRIINNDLLK